MKRTLSFYQNHQDIPLKIRPYFARAVRHLVKNLSVHIKIIAVAAISSGQAISAAIAYDSYALSQIKTPIDAQKFATYKYLFRPISEKISKDSILYFEDPRFFIFRITDNNLCRGNFCVTLIIKRCNNQNCPSTTILVQDHFYRYATQSAALGEWLRFPSRVNGNYTFVMVTDDFIARHHGI